VAAGVGAYQVSIFHLITHAFFKALLFLSAGSVIHAMSDEQDMRRMGGLAKLIPWTCGVMWVGNLALAGVPWFAGYYSKDAIISAAYQAHTNVGSYAFICTVLAAFLTAFYSWRLLFMTFHGTSRADHHTLEHVHESPPVMVVPLLILAVGAIVAGYLLNGWFIGEGQAEFWNHAIFNRPGNDIVANLEHAPKAIELIPLIVAVSGIALAWFMYIRRPDLPRKLAKQYPAIYFFLLNKWYFDELYDRIIVRPYFWIAGRSWRIGDITIIDGVPNGLAALAAEGSREAVKIQTGSLAAYAFVMLIGVVVLVGVFMFFR
jgi:NADH-quinone oxidoreductase subunit L